MLHGNITKEDEEIINEKLQFETTDIYDNLDVNIKDNVIYEKEKADANQAVLCIGLRAENFKPEDTFKYMIYNSILGGTPSSKLFQNVREKASLAYTASSRFYRYKGTIIINTGIYEENFEKAKNIILEQIEDIKNGKVSKEEFIAGKESSIANLKEWKDSKTLLTRLYLSNKLFFKNDEFLVGEMIENLKKVELEDVILAAAKIKLQVIYFLGGNENE